MKVTLLIPTLNELEGMKAIMPKIDPSWYDQLLIIDGHSTDGTVEYCREMGYPVFVQPRPGLRQALTDALPLIEGDIAIEFSPDGNSVPEAIPPLVEKMREGYDMVIVSRYLGDAKSDDDDRITAFGNWFLTGTVNLLHGGHYTDAMVMFRAWRKRMIYDLELNLDRTYSTEERLFRTRISWEPLMSVRALKAGCKVGEIPGDEPARIGGERKLQIVRWGCAFLYEFVRECFVWTPPAKRADAP